MTTRRQFYADLLERVIWTFVQAFGAAYLVDAASVVGLDGGDKVKLALTAAALAVLKCLGATQFGAPNTASTLPVAEDTERGHADPVLLLVVALIVLVILVIAGVLPT